MVKNIKLKNDVQMPQVGIGTWQINGHEPIRMLLKDAYDCGYRLIDTASAYGNEVSISKALKDIGILREELFLTDKAWNTNRGYNAVQDACKKSLKKLKTSYLDLYLIHWPATLSLYKDWQEINYDTWRGMERLYKDGLVRSIGVCNFKEHHLVALLEEVSILPMINQVEIHPGLPQLSLQKFCKKNGIVMEASSPLGNGKILENTILKKIAKDNGKSVVQVCLRWGIQKGYVIIPKSTSRTHLKENINIFDFDLTHREMKLLDSVPYCGGLGIDSDNIQELEKLVLKLE